jgi:hypothetical protein
MCTDILSAVPMTLSFSSTKMTLDKLDVKIASL